MSIEFGYAWIASNGACRSGYNCEYGCWDLDFSATNNASCISWCIAESTPAAEVTTDSDSSNRSKALSYGELLLCIIQTGRSTKALICCYYLHLDNPVQDKGITFISRNKPVLILKRRCVSQTEQANSLSRNPSPRPRTLTCDQTAMRGPGLPFNGL